jgi:7-cyano-7-deazaguanine reductase
VVGVITPSGGISIYPDANYGRPGTKYAELAEHRLLDYQMR